MDNIKFSIDFPDFINEETLKNASLPPQQTHPHIFSEAFLDTNSNNDNNKNNNPQIIQQKQKKNHQENNTDKNQSTKTPEKELPNHNQQKQAQNQESSIKSKLDPTKIVNRIDNSHDQHQQRQKQQRQKQQQQQQQQTPPRQKPQKQQQLQQQQQQQQQKQQKQQHQQDQQQTKNNNHHNTNTNSNQENTKKETRNSPKKKNNRKNKDIYIPKENPNNNNSTNNDTKTIPDTLTVSKPTIFYSFNSYLSAVFNSETQYLYTCDNNNVIFNQEQLKQADPITAFALLDEATYIYSTSRGIFVHSRIDGDTFQQLPNITDIRPDYTNDRCHFFVVSDSNLYICQYYDKQIGINLLHKNILDFDFSKAYRVIVKKKGIRLYKRNDFISFPLIKKDIVNPANSKFFCDDNYIYEFSNGKVIPYMIMTESNQLKSCEAIENVANVFSSDEVSIIINNNNNNNNNNNLSRIGYNSCKIQIQEQTYELKNVPSNVIINDGVISIWNEYDSLPTWLRIPDLHEGQKIFDAEFVKETAKSSIFIIESLNNSYNHYMEGMNKLVKELIPFVDQSFKRIRDQIKKLNDKLLMIEEIAINTAATPQMCLQLYSKNVDRAFRAAAQHSINNLIALCDNNRFEESLDQGQISDETLIEVAEVFTDNLEWNGKVITPHLVKLLLYFEPENEIFKARIKPLTSSILSATFALYPTVPPNSPLYIELRRLTHIAMSLQNS